MGTGRSEAEQKHVGDAVKAAEPRNGDDDEQVPDGAEYQRQTVDETHGDQLDQRHRSQRRVNHRPTATKKKNHQKPNAAPPGHCK